MAFATIYFAKIDVGYILARITKNKLKKSVCDIWDIIPQLLFLKRELWNKPRTLVVTALKVIFI
jgi:hypothetical protein